MDSQTLPNLDNAFNEIIVHPGLPEHVSVDEDISPVGWHDLPLPRQAATGSPDAWVSK